MEGQCVGEGCTRPAVARDLCSTCYQRRRRAGTLGAKQYSMANRQRRACTVDGCGRPHKADGLCAVHYQAAYYRRRKAGA